MKKCLMILSICAIFISMPAISALSVNHQENEMNTSTQEFSKDDYDGTFAGGLGRMYKENDEWNYDTYSYLIGVYKGNKLYGKIYNLDEEEIGSITAVFGHRLILGRIQNMEGKKAPIIGFLFWNEENFAGRIMSLFGPAPHIYGEYTPN